MDKSVLLNIKRFRAKLTRDPQQKVYAPLAENYRRVGLTEDAVDTCESGLEIYPGYLLCREVLGRIYFRVGRLEDARRELEAVHAVVKDNVELARVLAKLYLELGEKDLARPLLEFVLGKDPFDDEMRNLLAGLDRPAPAPDDESEADLFEKIDRPMRVFELEALLAEPEEEPGEAPSREKRSSATDAMLDSLEGVEDLIESRADDIMASIAGEDGDRPKRARKERHDIYFGKEKELRGAAVLAQAHMEIHLLEEAMNLLTKIRRELGDEDDGDYLQLESRLRNALIKRRTISNAWKTWN
ncbi:MAG: tetratricopeptide repeat protein [Deltaproteobacteria bacterium]|nr:tetratricopeptide repeat protein [Deltaproteobacteria bacterium]